MNKFALYGVLALVGLFLYFQFIGLVEDNAKLEIDNSNLKEAARLLGEDSARKSKINIKRTKLIVKIEEDKRTLQNDLSKLKTTPQQSKCDSVALPDGYIERLLKR